MDTADPKKLAYFVAKYRVLDDDELIALASKLDDLAEEAADAVQRVIIERQLSIPTPQPKQELTASEHAEAVRVSKELWNSPLSKRVQFQVGALAIVFAFSLLGPQGLRVGALWILLVGSALYYLASRIGRTYTRTVCSDADTSIEKKRRQLKTVSILLWPLLLIPAFLGVMLASALRGS